MPNVTASLNPWAESVSVRTAPRNLILCSLAV